MPFMMQERLEVLLEQTGDADADGGGKQEPNCDEPPKSADSVDEVFYAKPSDEQSPNSAANPPNRGRYVLLPAIRKSSSSSKKMSLDGLEEGDETDCVTSSADGEAAGLKDDAAAVQIVVTAPPNNVKQEWV